MMGGQQFWRKKVMLVRSLIDSDLQAFLHQYHIPGLAIAVVQAGELTYQQGYGFANLEHSIPVTEHTVFEIASVGKVFTAMLVVLLADEGLLTFDHSVRDYLPDLPVAWQPVTLRHILSHQSGLPSYTEVEDYWDRTHLNLPPLEVLGWVSHLPLKFKPGDYVSYDNTGFYLLGLVLETVAGQSYGELLRDRIFQPLRMTQSQINDPTELVPQRAAGYQWRNSRLCNKPYYSPAMTYAAGGHLASLADLVKWEQALCKGTLLPHDRLAALWQPRPSALGQEWTTWGYGMGLGWFVLNYSDRRVVGHNGSIVGFASNMTRFLDDHLTVIVLCNGDGIARPDAIAKTVAGHCNAAIAALPLQPPM